jgi:endonuclease I
MMYEHDRIRGPVTRMTMYMKGQESLEDMVNLVGPLDDSVSIKQFQRELKEMTIWEYLEMTT